MKRKLTDLDAQIAALEAGAGSGSESESEGVSDSDSDSDSDSEGEGERVREGVSGGSSGIVQTVDQQGQVLVLKSSIMGE
jgi:hypothetical protein